MLHPCQTDETMRIITEAARKHATAATANAGPAEIVGGLGFIGDKKEPAAGHSTVDPLLYMMAWLSVVGKVFGLQLPLAAWKEYWHRRK